MSWEYDAGEPYVRKKHGWNQRIAGVKREPKRGGVLVTRCPCGVGKEQAKAAVNGGIAYFDDPDVQHQPGDVPDRIFLVHDGVPYQTQWTSRGKSLHAYPVLPSEWNKLPTQLRAQLSALATAQGFDIAKWFERCQL